MDYTNLSKEELIIEIQSKDRFIEQYKQEKEQELDLSFAWTGNLGHWYWDVKENIVRFNKKKATALGYTEDEIPENVGFEWFTEKLHPDDYEPVMQNMRDHLHNKSEAYEVEYRIRAKSGDWKWYYDRGTVTKRTSNGTPLFLAGIVFDITEKKEIEIKQAALIEVLSQQLQMQENIHSIIFHDLANALNGVIGFSRVLKEIIPSLDCGKEIERYVEMLNQSADNSINITNSILTWKKAKIDSASNKEAINLLDISNEVLKEFVYSIEEKDIAIHNSIPSDCVISINKSVLKIALRNFISNAIKYSNNSGKISLEYKDSMINIKDNGIGMSDKTLSQLFKSSITPAKGTSQEKGHGIGLILVKELLDHEGITAKVNSEYGKGTTISIIL